jgi:predicted nucleic acid-binding protein
MTKAIENGLTTNYVTLLEVAHYTRNLPKKEFLQRMESIQNLSTLKLTDLDSQTATIAIDIVSQFADRGLGGRDCVIIASMRIAGVREIATHDQAFRRIDGIKVIDDIPTRLPQ